MNPSRRSFLKQAGSAVALGAFASKAFPGKPVKLTS